LERDAGEVPWLKYVAGEPAWEGLDWKGEGDGRVDDLPPEVADEWTSGVCAGGRRRGTMRYGDGGNGPASGTAGLEEGAVFEEMVFEEIYFRAKGRPAE